MIGLRSYMAFSKGGDIPVQAHTTFEAQQKAHELLVKKAPRLKRYQITVLLAKNTDGSPYVHTMVD
jgi:hypothetical protein